MAAELVTAGVGPEIIEHARIVLTELVANASQHGTGDDDGAIEIAWCLRWRHLRISVVDSGRVPELQVVPFADDMVTGRGLALVDVLSDTWEHDHGHAGGTRVTARLRTR